jgi:hypothetical protein
MRNIIAENIFNATITASSENPYSTFTDGLIDRTLNRTGRTIATSTQWIKFSYSAIIDVDTIAVFGNNITSGATVKIQANATDSWGSPSIDQALTFTKDYRASNLLGRDVGTWTYQFSSTESYQYWRLYIDDPSNTDGYIELGFVFMDENVDFPGMSVNQVFKRMTTSDPEFTTSQQVFALKRIQYNGANFNFPFVTETQKTTLDTFFDKTDIVFPYCMLVWESSLDIQRPLYVVNTTLPEWKRIETISGLMWSTTLEIIEVF